MARIPQHFIDEILSRSDIVSIIEARVPLKKAGREYQARCPFHDEKSPSFTVSPQKQFYHCFGCGAHGTVVNFLMEYDRLEFREAIEELAQAAGMPLPEEVRGQDEGPDYRPLYDVLARADQFYRQQLRQSDKAVDYLRGRGIAGEIARDYGMGYAPPGWDNLRRQLPQADAVAAGLLAEKDDGHSYDRFRDRVMFPIRDSRGRTIAFGGRTLGDDSAKYLNSPETPLFHKGRQLYGLYEAKQHSRQLDQILVVEGYMDVVALAQHGFHNSVATLGTATTAEHLQLLFRSTEEVIFCFDGDPAGQRAGWRALEQSLPAMRGTRRVRFLFMPEGEDPDSLVRSRGAGDFQALIDAALPASQVLMDGLCANENLASADGRSRVAERARPYVEKLPPEALKAELIREIARQTGMPATDLERLYAGGDAAAPHPPSAPPVRPKRPAGGPRLTPVRRAIQLLMNDPRLADNVPELETLRAAETPGAAILSDAIEFFRANPTYNAAVLLEHWRERDEAAALRRLAVETPRGEADALAREFAECVRKIGGQARRESLRHRYEALLSKQQDRPLDEQEQAEFKALLQQLRQ